MLGYLVGLPLLSVELVQVLNGHLDVSQSRFRTTNVIGLEHRVSYRKWPIWNPESDTITVRSWIAREPKLALSVSKERFQKFKIGDFVTIQTRAGFLGYEWIEKGP